MNNALIVGAGIAGTILAGELQYHGVDAHLVELEEEPTFRGIGIVLLPPAVRCMHELGLLDECLARGFPQHVSETFTATGKLLARTPLNGLVGPGYPPAVGIPRPVFGDIVRKRALDAGATLKCGTTVTALEEGSSGVEVAFSDGTSASYDIVVGADGVRSKIRTMLFPEEPPPTYIGQCSWRVLVGHRPPQLHGQMLFLGEKTRAGFNPILPDDTYIYLLHRIDDGDRLTPEQSYALMMELLGEYGGLIQEARSSLRPDSPRHYGPLYTTFVSGPWHRGRVILIGDAAHATPPHLASGAGIAIEDSIVLARCLREQGSVPEAFELFMRKRYERCRLVVETHASSLAGT